MGVIELSAIYGLVTGLLKDHISMVVAALLFAAVVITGLAFSPWNIEMRLEFVVLAWLSFNLSLFAKIFLPLLFAAPANRKHH